MTVGPTLTCLKAQRVARLALLHQRRLPRNSGSNTHLRRWRPWCIDGPMIADWVLQFRRVWCSKTSRRRASGCTREGDWGGLRRLESLPLLPSPERASVALDGLAVGLEPQPETRSSTRCGMPRWSWFISLTGVRFARSAVQLGRVNPAESCPFPIFSRGSLSRSTAGDVAAITACRLPPRSGRGGSRDRVRRVGYDPHH